MINQRGQFESVRHCGEFESVRHCGDIYARIVSGCVLYEGFTREPIDISSPWLNVSRVSSDLVYDFMYVLDCEYLLCTCGSRFFDYDGMVTTCHFCMTRFFSLGHPWFENITKIIFVEPISDEELLDFAVPQKSLVSWKSEGF